MQENNLVIRVFIVTSEKVIFQYYAIKGKWNS
jgi:hypothetical protein